jgi:hypothetical protein
MSDDRLYADAPHIVGTATRAVRAEMTVKPALDTLDHAALFVVEHLDVRDIGKVFLREQNESV